jgi:hypothetical protein
MRKGRLLGVLVLDLVDTGFESEVGDLDCLSATHRLEGYNEGGGFRGLP